MNDDMLRRTPTALVIEPDPIVAVALCVMLEDEGFACDPAFPFASQIQDGADLVLMHENAMPCALVPCRRFLSYRTETLCFRSLANVARDLKRDLAGAGETIGEAA